MAHHQITIVIQLKCVVIEKLDLLIAMVITGAWESEIKFESGASVTT